MIKKLIKILSIIFLIFIGSVLYLSFVGIKTDKFNEKITNRILEINKKISLDIKDIRFSLNPLNLTANITTKSPTIFLEGNKLQIRSLKTNVSLKSLIFDEFLLDQLLISTKPVMLNDLISFVRSFKDTTELFLLDRVIKDGFLTADINLKFDDKGNIKKDYKINGFIKNGQLNFLNKLNVKNLNLNFEISKNKYLLRDIVSNIDDLKFSSSLIKIIENKELFYIEGKILTSEKNFSKEELKMSLVSLLKNPNIEKARFSSESNISFNINKKLKFNDIDIQSKLNLDQLVIQNNLIDLKQYLPNLDKTINFEKHKIIISYNKDKLDIEGNGKISIKDKFDSINYKIRKKNDKFTFDINTNLKNNRLLIDFLDYEKKENLDASIQITGNYKKDKPIKFDLISLSEKNNNISFKNLNLSKDLKIVSIDSFDFDYLNNKKIKNQFFLKRSNSNYVIEGKHFDASTLINRIMDSDEENETIFNNFNSKINIKINKTYIDEINFINNLSGTINYKNNKIENLDLKSIFSNNKMISLSIETNNQKEKITKLFTDYPKPLIKRYNFIKGFEEGYLDYYSIKKGGTSNSLLIIDNFKVKEVPVFAKILSLASLQGIADLLTGEGIRFTDFEMKFKNYKGLTTIEEMYAIGPAVSILMDGYIESKKLISLSGTLVPATTINRTIASIPLLGNILVGKKTGEGVFGVSYKIKGPPGNLNTTVNPIKTLTPRFITRTLEKLKKD